MHSLHAGTQLFETLNAPGRHRDLRPTAGQQTSHNHGGENCAQCQDFYDSYVVLSSEGATALRHETSSQSTPLWFFSRRLRLTASNVSKVPKKEGTACDKAAERMISPIFSGNASTRHGKQMEPVARAQFIAKTGLVVSETGSVVHPEMPWLSATPDGVIESQNAILEIKCPNVTDCLPLIDSGKYDVRRDKDGLLILAQNGPNGYYSQVQFQMFCTKSSWCFFYVWSAQGDVTVLVPFSTHFVESNLARLEKFYFSEILPRLTTMHCSGKLEVLYRYSQICQM